MTALSPEKVTSRRAEIQGYAIVSDDNKIAGADGLIPARGDSLLSEDEHRL